VGENPPMWGKATICSHFSRIRAESPRTASYYRGHERAGGPHNRSRPRLTPTLGGLRGLPTGAADRFGVAARARRFLQKTAVFARKMEGPASRKHPAVGRWSRGQPARFPNFFQKNGQRAHFSLSQSGMVSVLTINCGPTQCGTVPRPGGFPTQVVFWGEVYVD